MTRSTSAYIVFYQQQAEFFNNESEPKDALFSDKRQANPQTDNKYPGALPNAITRLLGLAGNKKVGKETHEYRQMSSFFEKVRPEEMELDGESKKMFVCQ